MCIAWAAPTSGAAQASVDPDLVENARREGEVVWHTTQIINQLAVPMGEAFKAAYGVNVRFVRANPRDSARRLTEDAKAGRMLADVVDGAIAVARLKKAGLILKWQPPDAARLPVDMIDADGYWVATNVFVNAVGYNTELVRPGDEPKSYADLLAPIWKGRMGWSGNASLAAAPGFIGGVLKQKGEVAGRAYLEALAGQQVLSVDVTARQVLDEVIAGEFPIGLQIFNHHAAVSAGKGANVGWVAIEPVTAGVSVAAVLAAAPHPNAAKLLVSFLISEDGQKLFRDADYLPADPAVAPKNPKLLPGAGGFRATYFAPEEIEEQMPGWVKIYNELFK